MDGSPLFPAMCLLAAGFLFRSMRNADGLKRVLGSAFA